MVLFLAGCGEKVKDAPKAGYNIQLPPIEWRIRKMEDLQTERIRGGQPYIEDYEAVGFSSRDLDTGAIHVYTAPPRYVDDSVACTLGHEVMHVALGNYHKERK